ncbi:lysophospholipase D GDPD1-like [Diadema antillarum]|uniref:lysophospholipase D GDPD1-like n=1 Tax=Diadema antillarum TaxID=105358 RepID=UPI003A84936F
MSTLAIALPLSLFGGYVVASAVLFRFPNLLHLKKKSSINAKLIAHRGGAAEGYENTMTAFKWAREVGMEMLELDCQLTRDKQVVVSHDDDLRRVTGHEATIQETDYQVQLKPLTSMISQHYCLCLSICPDCPDRRIPLLREVFEEFQDFPINLDIKRNDDELIEKVLELIKEYKREKITVVGNFNSKIGVKVHKKAPDIPIIFGMTGMLKLVLLTYTGLLPFVPLMESYLEVPTGTLINDLEFLEGRSVLKAILRVYDFLVIRPCLFRHLQRRGIKIYLWVLNSEREWNRAIKLKVDGIMTDYPSKLKNFCDVKGFSTSRDPLLERDH